MQSFWVLWTSSTIHTRPTEFQRAHPQKIYGQKSENLDGMADGHQ